MSTSCLLIPHFTGRSDRFDNGVRRGATEAVKVCQDVGSFVLASGGLDRRCGGGAPFGWATNHLPWLQCCETSECSDWGLNERQHRPWHRQWTPSIRGADKVPRLHKTAKVGGHNVWWENQPIESFLTRAYFQNPSSANRPNLVDWMLRDTACLSSFHVIVRQDLH
jgi:hypothetical protein